MFSYKLHFIYLTHHQTGKYRKMFSGCHVVILQSTKYNPYRRCFHHLVLLRVRNKIKKMTLGWPL